MDEHEPVGTCFLATNDMTQFAEYSPCRSNCESKSSSPTNKPINNFVLFYLTRYAVTRGYSKRGFCQAGFSAAIVTPTLFTVRISFLLFNLLFNNRLILNDSLIKKELIDADGRYAGRGIFVGAVGSYQGLGIFLKMQWQFYFLIHSMYCVHHQVNSLLSIRLWRSKIQPSSAHSTRRQSQRMQPILILPSSLPNNNNHRHHQPTKVIYSIRSSKFNSTC